MGQYRWSLSAAAAVLAFGPGCTSSGLWKSKDDAGTPPPGMPMAPLSSAVRPEANPIVQASGYGPNGQYTPSSWAKFTGKAAPKVPASEMTLLWRNKIDFLPDPGRNGEMGAGLAGQLFLFGPGMQFAPAEGKLTVALYDETPRGPGQKSNLPEGWEFTKETLRGLRTPDERFGMSYALFLPWEAYRPDVTRIRIAVRYDPENGHPLYATESRITLDTTPAGGAGGDAMWSNQPYVPGTGVNAGPQMHSQPSANFSPLGGPPPVGGTGPGFGVLTSPGANFGAQPQPGGSGNPPTIPLPNGATLMPSGVIPPAPPGYGSVQPVGGFPPGLSMPNQPFSPNAGPGAGPNGLPPIAYTAPARR